MLTKEQLDAIKERVESANKRGDIAVQVYEEDAPALIEEVERLQQFERKAIYVIEENKRLQKERTALEFHLKVSSKALESEGENADTFQRALEKIYNDIGILTSQEIYRIVEDALEGMMALGDSDE